MATDAAPVLGYLILGIEEASGKSDTKGTCWNTAPSPETGLPFEAFVRVELRGGPRTIKVQTRPVPIADGEALLVWEEDLKLEVHEGSNELRIMLCREKYVNGKKGTAVIAACGIFVQDILQAIPVHKYFELFKPTASGAEGGYIRIGIDYVKAGDDAPSPADDVAAAKAAAAEPDLAIAAAPTTSETTVTAPTPKDVAPARRRRLALVIAAGALVLATGVAVVARRPRKAKKAAPKPQPQPAASSSSDKPAAPEKPFSWW